MIYPIASYSYKNVGDKAVHETIINWTTGRRFSYVWDLLIAIAAAAFLLNSACLLLYCCYRRMRRLPMAPLMLAMNLSNLFVSIACLVQHSLNLSHGEMVGHHHGCQVQALLLGFFSLLQPCILAIMAFVIERGTCAGVKYSKHTMLGMVGVAASACMAVSLIATYAPGIGGDHLQPSGTFCFFNTFGEYLHISIMGVVVLSICGCYLRISA